MPDVLRPSRGEAQDYTLFLAVFPWPDDAQRLAEAANALRRQHGLTGQCLLSERLHITLHALANFRQRIPQEIVDAVRAAAARVSCAPLPIACNQAMSFSSGQAKPFVLRCDAGSDAGIARLRQLLALELRRVGLRPRASATPHMTMLYDAQLIPEHAIPPICWTAGRFALVLSHVGRTHHQWLGEWALTDPR